MQHGQQVALSLRQLDAGAVATLESGLVYTHLLALETGRNAAHEDDGAGVANLLQQFLRSGGVLALNIEAQSGKVLLLYIVYLYAV